MSRFSTIACRTKSSSSGSPSAVQYSDRSTGTAAASEKAQSGGTATPASSTSRLRAPPKVAQPPKIAQPASAVNASVPMRQNLPAPFVKRTCPPIRALSLNPSQLAQALTRSLPIRFVARNLPFLCEQAIRFDKMRIFAALGDILAERSRSPIARLPGGRAAAALRRRGKSGLHETRVAGNARQRQL